MGLGENKVKKCEIWNPLRGFQKETEKIILNRENSTANGNNKKPWSTILWLVGREIRQKRKKAKDRREVGSREGYLYPHGLSCTSEFFENCSKYW